MVRRAAAVLWAPQTPVPPPAGTTHLSAAAHAAAPHPSPQVLRSRLQQRMDARTLQYSGIGDVVRKTLAREGIGGFYKGLAPNVLRVMPQSALTFLVYESILRLLAKQQGAAAVVGGAR